MKLLRYGQVGCEKPALIDAEGNIRCLSEHVQDITGPMLSDAKLEEIRRIDTARLPQIDAGVRIGPCVGNVGKFLCIGLNYADHAEEAGMTTPSEPEVFSKATSAICGPYDDTILPRGSEKLDWEVELGIIVGSRASYVPQEQAEKHIAGYCLCNDVSERSFQLERGNQWDKGKGCDSFGPMGPWLVTRNEVGNSSNLNIWLEVNAHRYQNGNTKTMIFKPDFIVSYLSQFMTLLPGDVISTGTPPGVGMGQNPPVFLRSGDVVELGIDKLGHQRQKVVALKNEKNIRLASQM